MPQVSIIVPVYNTEVYLPRCVDSILAQTFTDFELILVDDGSSDNCGAICDKYAQRDLRTRVIHKENGGVSSARNAGLDSARGDIVCFIDSDDYVEQDYLAEIHRAFQNEQAEIVFFGVNRISQSGELVSELHIPDLPSEYINKVITLTQMDMFGYTWIKAISRQTIGQIRFDECLDLFEDEVLTCRIMLQKPSIAYIQKALYNQQVTDGGLSRRTHQMYYSYCDAVYLAWKELLLQYGVPAHYIILEKANHMAHVCKFYCLEKAVHPILFFKGFSQSAFLTESPIHDALIDSVRKRQIISFLAIRGIYRGKMWIRNIIRRWQA